MLEKAAHDPGYAAKLALIERALAGVEGPVLDVGANTCGESEYLAAQGFEMVATDINEQALALSKERARLHGRSGPRYVAADAHRLPFANGCFAAVVVFEALHHMPDPARVLAEIRRVLRGGGRVFLYEPYAYDPYRRLSEARERLMRPETIEKSFGVRELRRLLALAGFVDVRLERKVLPPSEWKIAGMRRSHGLLRRSYHVVSRTLPGLFGNLAVTAWASARDAPRVRLVEEMLRCPVSGDDVTEREGGHVCDGCGMFFPSVAGIPVLIAEDAVNLCRQDS